MIIDGGATGDYPVPDGTPLPSGWSSPSRDLVITGGARVLGSDLTFAKGIISDYGVRTASPGTTKLTVTAGDVDVEKTGRIDMSGLGYEGGNRAVPQDGYGATAPGQTGSQYNNGGSHAGLGGLDGDVGTVAGSTYDNPYDPALPGGGGGGSAAGVTYGPSFYVAPNEIGGGVLDITAGTLENSGTIAANGQGGNGPIITFPFQFFAECGGAGAGGAIQAHAQTLTGNGSFEANGGDTCMPSSSAPPATARAKVRSTLEAEGEEATSSWSPPTTAASLARLWPGAGSSSPTRPSSTGPTRGTPAAPRGAPSSAPEPQGLPSIRGDGFLITQQLLLVTALVGPRTRPGGGARFAGASRTAPSPASS